jgi:hypothetical protein
MKRLFLASCLLFASVPAFAGVPVAKIQALLAKPKILCGRFDQTKYLSGMKRPLLSNGRFCIVSGKGILWRTLHPFPNTLRITRDEIIQLQGERVAMRIDAAQEPTVRVINGVLFSLIGGDLGQLEALFEIDGSIQGSNWNVALKARESAMAKVIGTVTLDGGNYVKNIAISEANGDRTGIVFSAVQTGESAMTIDEAALF